MASPVLQPVLQVTLLAASFLAAACARAQPAAFDVLVFSKTAGFRHDSIPAGIALVEQLGAERGFGVVATENAAVFTPTGLAPYRVVVWLNTTGDVLDGAQQLSFECFVLSGRGWVGVHAAADTEYGWPFYGALLGGARFHSHPAIQEATLDVESAAHPSTAHLPASFSFSDEWYNFTANPRSQGTVLVTLDESTYDPGPGGMGADHPAVWHRGVGAGRAWYAVLGHRVETYADPDFAAMLGGAIAFAAGCDAGECSPPLFADGFEAASVCAWTASAP